LRKITETVVTAVPFGELDVEELAPALDVSIMQSSEVEDAASTEFSVLSVNKSSEVAESYRSAAYSILELLGLE
jgi:hypothetical protein